MEPKRPVTEARRRKLEPLLNWMADQIMAELLAEASAEATRERACVESAPAAAPVEGGLSRLKAEKASRRKQAHDLARQLGEAWAMNKASFNDLELVAGLHGRKPTMDELLGLNGLSERARSEIADLADSLSDHLTGFLEGAHSVFVEV